MTPTEILARAIARVDRRLAAIHVLAIYSVITSSLALGLLLGRIL